MLNLGPRRYGCAPDTSYPLCAGAPKKEVYFMAIIDILTPYDAKKKAAHAAKTVKHGVSGFPASSGPSLVQYICAPLRAPRGCSGEVPVPFSPVASESNPAAFPCLPAFPSLPSLAR